MEDVFKIRYNTKLDKLEMPKEKKGKKIIKFIDTHKFISIIFGSFVIFSGINFYLIFSFMKILGNIWNLF